MCVCVCGERKLFVEDKTTGWMRTLLSGARVKKREWKSGWKRKWTWDYGRTKVCRSAMAAAAAANDGRQEARKYRQRVRSSVPERGIERDAENGWFSFFFRIHFDDIGEFQRHVRLPAMFIQYVLAAGCLSISFFFPHFSVIRSLSFCIVSLRNVSVCIVPESVWWLLVSVAKAPLFFGWVWLCFYSFSVEPFSGPLFNSVCYWLFLSAYSILFCCSSAFFTSFSAPFSFSCVEIS